MTIIQIDPLGTTTLLSTTSTLDDTVQDSDARSTTIAGLTTTISTSAMNPQYTQIYMANHYLDSLSDTEIMQMEEKLKQKEEDFMESYQQVEERPKVLEKTKNL